MVSRQPLVSKPDEIPDTLPPPPAPESGRQHSEISQWLIGAVHQSHRMGRQAHELLTELMGEIGRSPDPARKIEGAGLLGSLSEALEAMRSEREERQKRHAFYRFVVIAIGAGSGLFGIVAGIVKLARG